MNGASIPSAMDAQHQARNNNKRATLLDPQGSQTPPSKRPKVEHDDDQEDEEKEEQTEADVKLENFRKEAIYRELLSYKRQLSRAHKDCEKLRSHRASCEVRLSKVEIGWKEILAEAARVAPDFQPGGDGDESSPSLSDPFLDDAALSEALSARTSSTVALLQRLQSLPSSSTSPSPSALELKTRTLLSQSLESTEALRLLREEHDRTLEQLDETHALLLKAEKKFERFRSATVAQVEGRAVPHDGGLSQVGGPSGTAAPSAMSGVGASPVINGGTLSHSSGLKQEIPSAAAGPSDPGGQAVPSDGTQVEQGDMDLLNELMAKRGAEVDQLREERVALKLEIDTLKGKLADLPDDVIAETATFRLMQQHVQYLAAEYDTKRTDADRATLEAEQLKEGMEAFREGVFRDATEQVTDLQSRLSSRESDLSRLRAARDELKAESSELRAKDSDRARALDELRTLADARRVRLGAYQSEVTRLRIGRAAAEEKPEEVEARIRLAHQGGGEEDGAEEGEVEDDLVADLQNRLQKAEALLLALRDQLTTYASAASTATPSAAQLVDSETRAREDLEAAKARLDKLERILGPGATGEVREMADRLRDKEEEVKKAEAKVKSQEAATNMLYGEIDRLSTAWASLDEQNQSKVFNLASLEDKIQRLNADKAKADNRYFATMRQRDALSQENTVLTKLAERQQQKVEAASELQRSLLGQLTAAEKEISSHQSNVRAYQDSLAQLKRDNAELSLRSEQNSKHLVELNAALSARITEAETEAAARSRADERVAKLERQLQQAREKAATAAAAAAAASATTSTSGSADPSEVRELKKYNADLSRLLKCSTCSLRFKDTVLSRCGHTFCRECLDDRMAVRNRRCPTCSTQFGMADVLPMFL
ncbi:hypothetical protein JCM11641_003195 [Rhodosporidiobolus odoratus]